MKKIILLFAGLSLLTSCKNTSENQDSKKDNLIVSTENGRVEGFLNEENSVRKYFGRNLF